MGKKQAKRERGSVPEMTEQRNESLGGRKASLLGKRQTDGGKPVTNKLNVKGGHGWGDPSNGRRQRVCLSSFKNPRE